MVGKAEKQHSPAKLFVIGTVQAIRKLKVLSGYILKMFNVVCHMGRIYMTKHLTVPGKSLRLNMLLLGTRSICKAAMNEDQEYLSRRRIQFTFFLLEIRGKRDRI